MKRSYFERFFIPYKEKNELSLRNYVADIKKGKYRDRFNLGFSDVENGSWVLKNFTKDPNALFVGAMGSGKSQAAKFSIITWLLANSDKSIIFVIDSIKGATDYQLLFQYEQVYPALSPEKVNRVVELMYEELISRTEMFKEVGATDCDHYEQITGKKLARVIGLFEEFHSLTHAVFQFDKEYKNEGSSAFKIHQIMRAGRSVGVWVIACSQKSSRSDIPSEMVINFTQKQIFKVMAGEANYVLGHDGPARLFSSQKGRCFNDQGQIQFPYMVDSVYQKLLDNFMKENEGECARLTPSMIKDVLEGKTTREQYKHKKLSELVKGFAHNNSQLVITMLHEAMGCSVEELQPDINLYSATHIVLFPSNNEKAVVMLLIGKKVTSKHVNKLAEAIIHYKCHRGIIYTDSELIPDTTRRTAMNLKIEIVDHEDLLANARRIEYAVERGVQEEYYADKLANDDKEAKAMGEETIIPDSMKRKPPPSFPLEEKDLPKEKEDSFIDDFFSDNPFEEKNDISVVEDPEIVEDDNKPEVSILEQLQRDITSSDVLNKLKKQKRPTLNIAFNLLQEDSPSLLINCLKNSEGEVYRILTYIANNNKIVHKYFFDKRISSNFNYEELNRLGLKNTDDWNNDPMVLDADQLKQIISRYLENFNGLENQVYVNCWEDDLGAIEEFFLSQSNSLMEPTTHEDRIESVFGFAQSRATLIKDLGLKENGHDLFEPIEIDYNIWSQTL